MEFNKSLIQTTRRTSSITKEVAKSVPVTYKDFRRSTHPRQSPHLKKTARIVFKSGLFNIEKSKPHSYHVFPDIVTTFIEARWRWTVLYCILTSVLSWLAFAGAWWTLLYLHGDFEDDHLPDNNSTWVPCVKQIYGFTSTFLFSIEIHTTIGYGTRALTLECPVAIVLMCIEGILGTLMQSFIIGVVFAKLTRPKNRAQTLLFSKYALINQRDRRLSLIFRVGNIRKSRIIAVSVHAYLIRYHTRSGDVLKDEQIKLDLLVDACDDIIFMFPITVVHKIDEPSPLYDMSAEDLLRSKIEILVVLEGTIESTGQPVQLRSSYTSKEILWGHRFVHLIRFRQDRQGHELDYSNFENTIQVNTPLCSARQLDDFYSHTRNGLKSLRVSCPKCHCDGSHS